MVPMPFASEEINFPSLHAGLAPGHTANTPIDFSELWPKLPEMPFWQGCGIKFLFRLFVLQAHNVFGKCKTEPTRNHFS